MTSMATAANQGLRPLFVKLIKSGSKALSQRKRHAFHSKKTNAQRVFLVLSQYLTMNANTAKYL